MTSEKQRRQAIIRRGRGRMPARKIAKTLGLPLELVREVLRREGLA